MELNRALDSCYIAAYRLVEGLPKADVIATYLLMLALSGYIIDLAVALDMMHFLSIFGPSGRALIILGGLLCSAIGFSISHRSPQLISDKGLRSSTHLLFRRLFFFIPTASFIALMFVSLILGVRLLPTLQ